MSKPRPWAVADIETDPFEYGNFPKPFAAGFFDGKTYVHSWGKDCMKDLARWCKSFPGIVYFHNGGKFDIHYLVDYLFAGSSKPVKFCKINGRIAKLPFGSCELRDSLLLLPVSLKRLGTGKKEIDYNKMTRGNREANKAEILEYLEADHCSLYVALQKFFDEYGKGLTLASRAFAMMGELEEKPGRTSLEYDSKFREFYFGGRVQCLQPGEFDGPIYCYDINSAYPYAMTFPHWFDNRYLELSALPEAGIEQCLIDFDGYSHGALPCRDDKTGNLCFPNETRRWKCTGWELKTGVELGRVRIDRVNVCYLPQRLKDFSRYVDHFWKLKAEAKTNKDIVRYEFAKLMLNAAYGKFALNPRHFTENVLCPFGIKPEADKKGDWGEAYSTNENRGFWEFQRPQQLKSSPCYNVCTASSITGFVRAYSLRALHGCVSPFYYDTDGLKCRGPGSLNIGNSLGEWKEEGIWEYGAFAGKKLYAGKERGEFPELDRKQRYTAEEIAKAGWKIASKGSRPMPWEIIQAVRGETITWRNAAPSFSLGTRSKLFVERRIQRTTKDKAEFALS